MMYNKISLVLSACAAAAMCLSACDSKPEDTAAIKSKVPSNSVVPSGMTTAPEASVNTGDIAIDTSAEKVGAMAPSGEEILTKSINPADPVKENPRVPTKSTEAKAPQPVAAPTTVAAKTAVAAVRPASFGQCAVCHSDKQGQKSGFGPNLFGIADTKAGAVPGYTFSAAMASSGVLWNRENLDAFLLSPQSKIPGTKMSFSGVKDAAKRKEIVDYIIALK